MSLYCVPFHYAGNMVGAIFGAVFPSFYIVIFVFVSLGYLTFRTFFKARDIYYQSKAEEKKNNLGVDLMDPEKKDRKSQEGEDLLKGTFLYLLGTN